MANVNKISLSCFAQSSSNITIVSWCRMTSNSPALTYFIPADLALHNLTNSQTRPIAEFLVSSNFACSQLSFYQKETKTYNFIIDTQRF